MYILQYQPVASGLQPAVASGALPGFSVRAAGRTKNGPEMFRNGPEALQKRFGACPGTDRERFGIFGTHSGRGRSGRSERGRLVCSETLLSGSFETFGGSPVGGVRNVRREGVWHVRRLSWRGRSGRSESLRTEALRNIRNPLRTGRSGADCSFGPFADGSDADRTVSGCGYLISRSGCSRRKCSQLCDPLREAAFLPPPSPLTRSGPRTAWSGLEVV